MPEWVWGYKTVALFDVWSIEHVLSGLSIGSLVVKARGFVLGGVPVQRPASVRVDLLGVLFLAYLWEAAEHYLEAGVAGEVVTRWFAGVEVWGNRMITDPLMVVVGYVLVERYPRMTWPARALSGTWVIVHVFVFPDCMYLHRVF